MPAKNRNTHLGQARSASRKRARQRARKEALRQEADTLGITPEALSQQKYREGQAVMITAAQEAQLVAAATLQENRRWR